MSEAKHTPGPWSVPHFAQDEVGCDCAYVLCDGVMGAVCTITVSKEGDDPPIEQAKANARLIAAAPDLLAALKRVENSWRDKYTGPEDPRAMARFSIWREMLAAIAKAEGRS